jgi:anti-sigma B factor antagonist
MPFEFQRRERDGVVILALRGRLVAGEPVEAFRDTVEELTAAGQTRIALDMRQVNYIDSSALGALVVGHTKTHKAGGAMAMFGLTARNLELMVLTKLSTVFRLYEEEIDAVNSCIPGREAQRFDILEFIARQRTEKAGGSSG